MANHGAVMAKNFLTPTPYLQKRLTFHRTDMDLELI